MIRSLSTKRKIQLLCAILLLPVVLLVFELVREKNKTIDFAREELEGNRYVAAIRPAVVALVQGDG